MKLAMHLPWMFGLAVVAACSSTDETPPSYALGSATTAGQSSSASMSTGASLTTTGAAQTTGATSSGLASTSGASTGAASTGMTTFGVVTTASATSGSVATTAGVGGSATTASSTTQPSTTASGAGGSTSSTSSTISTSVTSSSTTGGMAGCASGPLDTPIPNCSPEPVPDTGDYYADCVARINQFRWECQCLPPLERWTEAEDCADQQAEYDYQQNSAHAGISANICSPGGNAQNECPGYGPNFGIIDFCLQQMWDEGPGADFNSHGHYLNMSNENFSRVACGMYVTPQGDIWAVQNFN